MGNTVSTLYAFAPETWEELFLLEPEEDDETLLQSRAARYLGVWDLLHDYTVEFPIRQHAEPQQLEVWKDLLAALGYDLEQEADILPVAADYPAWLLEWYPSDYFLGRVRPAELGELMRRIDACDLVSAIERSCRALGWKDVQRLHQVLDFMRTAAQDNCLLLAIESMS